MSKKLVLDAGPLIVLARAEFVHLLPEIAGGVVVPRDVVNEVVVVNDAARAALQELSWFEIADTDSPDAQHLRTQADIDIKASGLGLGEQAVPVMRPLRHPRVWRCWMT